MEKGLAGHFSCGNNISNSYLFRIFILNNDDSNNNNNVKKKIIIKLIIITHQNYWKELL